MFYKKLLVLSLWFFSLPIFASLILFVEPNDGYKPVLHEINSAKHTIDMAMYILKDKRIINALITAEKRGVNVRVILEKKPYGDNMHQSHETRKKLEKAGIKVKWSNPSFFSLTHEKSFDVDQQRLIIMTLNQTYSAYHYNREYGAIDLALSDVMEFLKVFEGDWNGFYPGVLAHDLVWSPNNSSCKLIKLIKSAQRSIYVEAEALENKTIENLLIQKAQRGIDVRIILPPQKNQNRLQHLANGSVMVCILDKKPLYLHAKLIIVDNNKAYLGSENLTSYSLQMNRELGILVYPTDNLKRLTKIFKGDWSHAKPVLEY